jgi:CTP synthase
MTASAPQKRPKFVFITGGVSSSLGKGLASAALAALFQARGFKVRLRKMDPYLNVDPGTMSPYQHGEVFVTDDGAETDLDLGHYERFTGVDARSGDSVSAGRIYQTLLMKERRGDYLGGTVQVIPHVTDLIKQFVLANTEDTDIVLVEIGGTVGDIEGLPFIEAIRQLGYDLGLAQVVYIHLTLMPYLAAAKELKTKPTQHSVKELRSIGIQPNILLVRAEREITQDHRKKIALFCNLAEENVIPALDQKNIYQVPLSYHKDGLDTQVLKHLGILESAPQMDLSNWEALVERTNRRPEQEVNIAVVGKYNVLKDAYKSLIEALDHAGISNNCKVNLTWVSASALNEETVASKLNGIDGILIPGGFGKRGVEGKIAAIRHARESGIPFFGICLGMQLACIEIARHIIGIEDATSGEFDAKGHCVIDLMTQWYHASSEKIEERTENSNLGGTMRLGAYPCHIKADTLAHRIYSTEVIQERHRHRYEFNIQYKKQFEEAGVIFSGMSKDGLLTEIIELPSHPWFLAVQFHPEFKSRPFAAHPVFASFIKAALEKK